MGSWETVLQLMVSYFFHGFCWKLRVRVVGRLQFMAKLCLICSVYYFIPHPLLADLTSSSLVLFSHKSFSSEFPCSLPAVEQLWRSQKTLTTLKNCSEMHGFVTEAGFSWSSLYVLNCPIASSDGDVLRNCGLVQTTGLLFDCLSNPASLKDEMFSLAQCCSQEGRLVVSHEAGLVWRTDLERRCSFYSLNPFFFDYGRSPAKRSLWLSSVCPPIPKQRVLLSLVLCYICSCGHNALNLNKL